MLELLGALVVKALEKIMGEAIDVGAKSLLDRRKLFKKFFELYEAAADLEAQSKAAYIEFAGYAGGTEILTKTVPAKKLDKLNQALDLFMSRVSAIRSVIDLYEGSLLISLNDVAAMKGMNLRHLRMVLPEAVGYDLFVPTKRSPNQPRLDLSSREYDAKKYLKSREAMTEFGLVRIDLRERESIERILGHSEAAVQEIAKVKEALGAFIRKNFPLDKVII
ncbi:hypothetical protein IVB46_25955 [Bradyrhizobium sp. 61]|uniref:hypothetical protein n=1 Tax=unclassified Bradyrhizobium TaxID=2631580 RepID=UPI001FF8B976|nr:MULTISPECIES: hypothetical protein [unclassified Bradyrhizobium]MCK1278673.1 hypothetical protein [Bradyrhizobium sp. 61]MCK1448312.1 hypothetical protein [Bradyrhizobium sp. 48]MCK1463862.1 hypothetical protein [Bradyrhizobium sp. 2]